MNSRFVRRTLDFARPGALASAIAALTLLAAHAAAALPAQEDDPPRLWQAKIQLTVVRGAVPASDPGLCTLRYVDRSAELSIVCRHELGTSGELALVRSGAGERSEPPLWSAPLASPFQAVAALSDDAVAALLAGELALRIDTGSGLVAEGVIGTPIFGDGFDYPFGICRWTNFLCADDNNVCTTTTCSPTGVCGTTPNTMPCDLPDATGGCFLGGCIIQTCDTGFSHCDTSNANGCEVNHNSGPGSCTTLVNFVGSYPGDTVCGQPACGLNMNGHVFATRTGLGEAFYSAENQEVSNCLGDIEHGIELIVPPGVDYDLYVYRDCQLVAYSNKPTGDDEFVRVSEEENALGSESFVYQVEIRWFSGRSCEEWTLNFQGLTC